MRKILLFVSCLSVLIRTASADPAPVKDWTLMVYLSGDNNLGELMLSTIARLKRQGSTEHLNILVQYDGANAGDSKRMVILKNGAIVVQKKIEYNMGNPLTLVNFISWGLKNYPAQKTAVVVNTHGRGILNIPAGDGAEFSNQPKDQRLTLASSPDETSKMYMNEKDLVAPMSYALQKLNGGKKIDLWVYESCLMGNLEILATLSPIARYLVASEYMITINSDDDLKPDSEDGVSMEYLVKVARMNPGISPEDLGQELVAKFQDVYKKYAIGYSTDDGEPMYPEATLALYENSALSAVLPLLSRLSAELVDLLKRRPELADELYYQLMQSSQVDDLGYMDLGILATVIGKVTGSDSAREIGQLVYGNNSFIRERAILHLGKQNHAAGVSIFFPGVQQNPKELASFLAYYRKLGFAKKTQWHLFFEAYYRVFKQRYVGIYTRWVEDYLRGQDIRLRPWDDRNYNEYYLFLKAWQMVYDQIQIKNWASLEPYLRMIGNTRYSSEHFSKHKKDLRFLLNDALKSVRSAKDRLAVQNLLGLF